MKTFRLILALAAVALTAVSCVEKSGKYQTLLAQRDSLLTVEQKYDQTLEILNEIETGFQSIREVEDRVMTQISDIENKPLDKKQQMVSQINQIKGILLQNKERIAELEAQFAQSGRKNASLAGYDQTSAGRNDPEKSHRSNRFRPSCPKKTLRSRSSPVRSRSSTGHRRIERSHCQPKNYDRGTG